MASKKTVAVKKVKPVSCTYAELEALGIQPIRIGDAVVGQVVPRHFAVKPGNATGSYGLALNGKVLIQLPNGKFAECQASINITVIGSAQRAVEDAPKEEAA